MSTPVQRALERLEGVKERSPGQYVALCPAHPDKSPSLSVKERDDGTVLVHCFAGCSAADVMTAIGLSLADLFDRPPVTRAGPRRNGPSERQIMDVVNREAIVAATAAVNAAVGNNITLADGRRAWLASERLSKAREMLRARPYR